MANKKSALKKARHDAKVGAKNRALKKELKRLLKKAGKKDLPLVYKKVDKAAKRGVVHKNKAARLKSHAAQRSH